MYPWGHLAFGYLLYSVAVHATDRRAPDGSSVLVLAFATQVPDLVDKPLSWGFGVFTVGYGAAHSILVVVPALCVAGLLVARRLLPGRSVAAYAVGHLSHLAGDLVYPVLRGEPLPVGRLLWPLASFPPPETDLGLVERTLYYLLRYLYQVVTLDPSPLLVVQLGLLALVGLLWLADGAPGPLACWRLLAARLPHTAD
jgi:hypothetical protein